jgi:hypothetical protein
LHANDGETDEVNCGRGRDKAIVDLHDLDRVSNCELIIERAPSDRESDQENAA